MALTTVQTNNKLIKFTKGVNREWVRENLFAPYMGEGITSIIRKRMELTSGGEQMNIPLVARLAATAIGSGTLAGNEESVDNYGMRVWIDWARNAVKTNKAEKQKDSAAIFDVARPFCRTGSRNSTATKSSMRSMRWFRNRRRPASTRLPANVSTASCSMLRPLPSAIPGFRTTRSRAVRQARLELLGHVRDRDRNARHHGRQVQPRCHAFAQAHRPCRQPENPPVQEHGRQGIFRGLPWLADLPRSQDRSGNDQLGRPSP
jgi:hypothetical protein